MSGQAVEAEVGVVPEVGAHGLRGGVGCLGEGCHIWGEVDGWYGAFVRGGGID